MNEKAKDRPDRATRLANELRANLAKRKAQARSRQSEQVSENFPKIPEPKPAAEQQAREAERGRSYSDLHEGGYRGSTDGLDVDRHEDEGPAGSANEK